MNLPTLTINDCRDFIESRLLSPGRVGGIEDMVPDPGLIGVELELFPYRIEAGRHQPVPLFDGEKALIHPLVEISVRHGGVAVRGGDHGKVERIEFTNGNRFLFEPGGQVEISTAPAVSLMEVELLLHLMKEILAKVSLASGINFRQIGTHPYFSTEQIGNQLDKPRYRSMKQYFDGIGPYGGQMMLQTCAMHINLDLGTDDNTQVRRIVLANALAPFGMALFAHSRTINGSVSGYRSYRGFLWQNLDEKRTGILPLREIVRNMTRNQVIDTYLQFALEAPLIYIRQMPDKVLPSHYTLKHWLNNPIDGVTPELPDLEQHFSMLFPEVRLKGYLELRSVDAPPEEWQMVPLAFYTGLLYNEQALGRALDLLLPHVDQMDALMMHATHGLESDEVFRLAMKLLPIAIEGFSDLPEKFRNSTHQEQLVGFFERFAERRVTFADMS